MGNFASSEYRIARTPPILGNCPDDASVPRVGSFARSWKTRIPERYWNGWDDFARFCVGRVSTGAADILKSRRLIDRHTSPPPLRDTPSFRIPKRTSKGRRDEKSRGILAMRKRGDVSSSRCITDISVATFPRLTHANVNKYVRTYLRLVYRSKTI